jgi:hypothetical protein
MYTGMQILSHMNLHEFGELEKIDSLLENSEAGVNISNSHKAHSGCDLSIEYAYSP